jgi:hypothetical protein
MLAVLCEDSNVQKRYWVLAEERGIARLQSDYEEIVVYFVDTKN